MRFDASQHMRMSQQMKLAPQMIQSMEILQMSQAELQERIERELENNATLELAEPGDDFDMRQERDDARFEARAERGPLEVDAGKGEADFERLDTYEQANPEAADNEFERDDRRERASEEWEARPSSGSYDDGERDGKMDAMANAAERSKTVSEQLAEQWSLSEVDEKVRPLGELIVAYIEDDGYLRTPLEKIADNATGFAVKPTIAQLEHALHAVQLLCEPPGVGARDLKECLLLQIDARQAEDADGAWEHVRTLVNDHLDDLAQNRLPKIAKATGLSVDELKASIEKMRTLNLAPGRQLHEDLEPGIVPDAFVEYDAEQDRYIAYLNDRRLPNLRVNQEYAKIAKDREAPKPTRDFIKTNLVNANFLIDAIEQRKRTVLRVLEAVVAAQRDFFDYGPQNLRPLPMTKVAEQLGIHVATVSRAVADKYIQTPRGIVPLRKFFTGGTVSAESGEEVSWDAIKAALSEVVEKEDKKNPLSDDELAEELKKRGLEIARRTVAKYRGQLGIPTGRLRKAH